ncbi:glycosyltransferase family 4 protein [Mycetocola sp.]|uniref:glycosyltransferase family 4 protein n=1 Tax=Mycetocola sp. TaxID=1871042 RepID=UPI00398A41B7
MRVAVIAETFLPQMNGVTHSLLRVLDHLAQRGDDVLVLAPGADEQPTTVSGFPIVPLPSFALPSYRDVRLATVGVPRLTKILRRFAPDVIHLASPFVLGWQGVRAAEALGIPTVSVYQTDVPAYAARYGVPAAEPMLWNHVRRLHARSTMTLAPSASAMTLLAEHGVERLSLWGRGVDSARFSPERRDEELRSSWAAPEERVVGYVGRLAAEKQVDDLRVLQDLPGVRLVIVGDGPLRETLEAALPAARFLGFLTGDRLARALASFDVFVHPGESETFGQTIQEAMASGVPVVATGRGGPLDLVDSSRNGWLYRPGDLADLRGRVADLTGDDAKRRAFALAARRSVEFRSWPRLCARLVGHYEEALVAGAVDHRRLPVAR